MTNCVRPSGMTVSRTLPFLFLYFSVANGEPPIGKIVRKLYDLLVFSMEPDDLNEQLKELESEDPKTCTFIYRFIKTKLNK